MHCAKSDATPEMPLCAPSPELLSALRDDGWSESIAALAPLKPPLQTRDDGFFFEPPPAAGICLGAVDRGAQRLELWGTPAPKGSSAVFAHKATAVLTKAGLLQGYAVFWLVRPRNPGARDQSLLTAAEALSEDAARVFRQMHASYVPAFGRLAQTLHEAPWLHLELLEVAAAHRGQGLGGQLLQDALHLLGDAFDPGILSVTAYPLEFANGWALNAALGYSREAEHTHGQFATAQVRLARFYHQALGAHRIDASNVMVAALRLDLTVLHHDQTHRWTIALR